MMKTLIDEKILINFATALILLTGVGILSNYHIKQLAEDTQWVDHTYNVLLQLKDLFADVKTGARSFILTGNEKDLEPYHAAMADIAHPMNQVRLLTRDNPIQQKRLDILEPLIFDKIAMTNQLIALKRKGAPDDFLLIDKSRIVMDKIRVLEHDLENEEYQLLKRRNSKAKETNKLAFIFMNAGTALAFAIIFIAIMFISRDNRARRLSEEAVKKSEERLMLATKVGGIGIWDFDIVNNVLLLDEQMYKIYGIKRENSPATYETWKTIAHPEDLERSEKEIQQAIRGDKEFDTEFRLIWPDKSIRHIKASGIVERDTDGKAVRMIGMNWDITERNKLKEELQRFSTYDELTGLYNRRGFKFLVEQQLKEARRSKKAILLFLIDLNKMKNINDQFGHHAGDLSLIDIAKLLKQSFRETDIIARWGGDEFVALGVGAMDKDAPIIKKRLEANLHEYNLNSQRDFKLSMSIGEFVAEYDSKNSLEELIIEADKKMYQQKKDFPNQA